MENVLLKKIIMRLSKQGKVLTKQSCVLKRNGKDLKVFQYLNAKHVLTLLKFGHQQKVMFILVNVINN